VSLQIWIVNNATTIAWIFFIGYIVSVTISLALCIWTLVEKILWRKKINAKLREWQKTKSIRLATEICEELVK
jgi:peptidoglycan/LPS O-acetylase OafA/YrhL